MMSSVSLLALVAAAIRHNAIHFGAAVTIRTLVSGPRLPAAQPAR